MPELSDQELAARYGFALAVLNSNPELKALFQRAVANTYTPERFQAELRSTQWFQQTSEAARKAEIAKNADPATYKQQVAQFKRRVQMMAAELGAVVSFDNEELLGGAIHHMYYWGWDDNQIREWLSQYVKYTDGRLLGQAGQWERELRDYAAQMGVRLSDQAIQQQVKNAIGGKQTFEDALGWVRQMAASAMPHLAERFAAGDTLEAIADPYRQSMAQLLEMNPEGIDVFDPTIQKALAHTGQDGKPVLRTLYDFQNDLRQDPRWLKTKNAQDAAMETTNRVLRDMGLIA